MSGSDPSRGFLFQQFRKIKKSLKKSPDLVDTAIAFLFVGFVMAVGMACNAAFPDYENEEDIFKRCMASDSGRVPGYCEESYGHLENE